MRESESLTGGRACFWKRVASPQEAVCTIPFHLVHQLARGGTKERSLQAALVDPVIGRLIEKQGMQYESYLGQNTGRI